MTFSSAIIYYITYPYLSRYSIQCYMIFGAGAGGIDIKQVSVVAKATKSGWRPDCPTPAPTPTGAAAPFAVYGADQRCLEAQPLSSVRMLADRSLALEPPGTPEGCYEACYAKGLTPEFYFEVRDGECYCCQTW